MSERYDLVRDDLILRELNTVGRVAVHDLVQALGVSAVTIRKDLESLESRSLLRRVRGGAVIATTADEGAFGERMRHDAGVKHALAKEVAALVTDDDIIALDSSTTSYYLAQELLDRRDLHVVTYGMRVAMLFMEHSTATVILPGGVVRRASSALVGAFGDVFTGRGRISKGFFGTAALSTTLGALELSLEEANAKRTLLSACDAVYLSLSASKIGGFGLHSFAAPAEIGAIFTDELAPDDFIASWTNCGVPVTRLQRHGDGYTSGKKASSPDAHDDAPGDLGESDGGTDATIATTER